MWSKAAQRGAGPHLSLVEVECGGKRMYWTTHVCLSSTAACPGGSFWDRMGELGPAPAEAEIWPGPALTLSTLVPSPHCPGTGLRPWVLWPQGPCEAAFPVVPTQLRGEYPWDDDGPWWEGS